MGRQYLDADSRIPLEEAAKEGDGPVGENAKVAEQRVRWTGISSGIRERRPPKAKHVQRPIAYQYFEGKMKRMPRGM